MQVGELVAQLVTQRKWASSKSAAFVAKLGQLLLLIAEVLTCTGHSCTGISMYGT